MKVIIATLVIIILCSCTSRKHAVRYFDQHPNELAILCANEYPVKERVIRGKTVYASDTTTIAGQEIPCPDSTDSESGRRTAKKVKCPDTKIITLSGVRTDTSIQENTAQLTVLTNNLNAEFERCNQLEEELKVEKSKFTQLMCGFLILFAFVALLVYHWIRY